MIEYACANEEINPILKLLPFIRFESMVGLFQSTIDPNLELIKFYEQCSKPNLQHFFLANAIKHGHFVMTTNFDLLIEHALLQSNVQLEDIIPVITENDFKLYSNPKILFKKGKKTIYKLHGSTRNLAKNKSTKESLKATIRDLCANKMGMNIFGIEPFKASLFHNISNERSLIVIGYSGSDDFDIIPTLRVLKNVHTFIWINHKDEGSDSISSYEIELDNQSTNSLDRIDRILIDLKEYNIAERFIKIEASTTKLIESLFKAKPKISLNEFKINPKAWLEEKIMSLNPGAKVYFPLEIYKNLSRSDDVLRCAKKLLSISSKSKKISLEFRAKALDELGSYFFWKEDFSEALKFYSKAYNVAVLRNDPKGMAIGLNNKANVYLRAGNFSDAKKCYIDALEIDKIEVIDPEGNATTLVNLAGLVFYQKEYLEAKRIYLEALDIAEKRSDLRLKIYIISNLGLIDLALFKGQDDKQKLVKDALKKFQGALKTSQEIPDFYAEAINSDRIGQAYFLLGEKALTKHYWNKALEIFSNLGLSNSKDAQIIQRNLKRLEN